MMNRTALLAHGSAELYGSDRMFLESVTALTEAGWRVVVTVPTSGPLVEAMRAVGAEVEVCPTPVIRKAALRPKGFLRLIVDTLRALPVMIRLIRRVKPDLVFVNTLIIPLWLVLARVLRRPVIAHVHEAEEGVPRVIKIGLAAPLLATHKIITNSAATGTNLRHSIDRLGSRIQLVYNGVSGPTTAAADAAVRDVARDRATPVKLLLVARISPRKGTDTAVEALDLLRQDGIDATLDIAGSVFSGWEWFEDQVRASVQEKNLSEMVRFHGFQSPVWDLYADSDIAIVPSRIEPFGNTAVEAQLAGVPVVVTDVQGLPETVENGTWAPVVPADDPRALADAIAGLLKDWPATVERANGARKRAAERFAPQRYRDEIVRVATELTDR